MDELRVETGVTWASHVEQIWDEKPAERRCPESGGEMNARKTEIAMEDCIKSNIERVGEEWKAWEKKHNGKGIHGFIFLNMNGIHIKENNNNNKMQFDPSLVTGQLLL